MDNKNQQLNTGIQSYKGIKVRLIERKSYTEQKAKRFLLIPDKKESGMTNQNVWIPNCYLLADGTIKPSANIDFVFKKAYWQKKLFYAGISINPLQWR